ncbi:hypothetical protein Hypma_013696 [Hypsizygus marmoreus]|uniref:Polysaccharide lyase 14 domain-containing protein n=1 Tax=Hypsizygus marmoreus TaxID=39966 RepID=A0A369JFV0_HYPMA|nr:hypothetical protein Hypma_013696 [Hypsizygus marmoreus]
MFTSKTAIVFLAFCLALVNAVPVHQHHRRACRANSGVAASNSTTSNSTTTAAGTAPTETGKPETIVKANTNTTSVDAPKSSKTTSDAVAEPTPSKSSASSFITKAHKLAELFPVSKFSKSWSTSPFADNALPLSDSTLRPTRLLKALSHDYVSAPDGKKAMKAHFPKGSYTYTHQPQGGLSFYAPGPSSLDLSTAKEATFGYAVYFEEGFAFNLGGKLPGLYGGNSDAEALSCSGGRRSTACFSARLMWRAAGAGEFYTYLPPYTDSRFAANKKQCSVAPKSDCNPTYGASVGRGAFTWPTGKWTTISERVRLNDVGKANGELELFVNGKSVINVDGLIIRDSAAGRIRGIQMQTFFGGSKPEYASPKDQNVFFADFSAAITQSL